MLTVVNPIKTHSPVALPRLVYVGDVPVEASYYGSVQLYRLLQGYPPDALRVIEFMHPSAPQRRLPAITYHHVRVRSARLLTTRLHRWASSALSLVAPWGARRIARLLGEFRPEGVLTVVHGYSWMAAAAFARRHHLPLHLIVHDDWPGMIADFGPVRMWVDRQLLRCYREAVSRLCVSPSMAEQYERRYGVTGTVLYPTRGADAVVFDAPPSRLRRTGGPLTAAYFGTINSPGCLRAIGMLADSLNRFGGRLLLFGPLSPDEAVASGLARPNIDVSGFLEFSELIRRCRDEADFLFVPISFAAENRSFAQTSFPSKLTDYTMMGLPLLIYGPSCSSVVRWACENEGVAEVVTQEDSQGLSEAVGRLCDPHERERLALAALQHGNEFFAYDRVSPLFLNSLRTRTTRAN